MILQLEKTDPQVSHRTPRASVSLAFFSLAAADLVMRLAGFRRLHQTVKHWPVSKRVATDPETIAVVRAAIDQAATYYLKHALCLQRSAVMTCLLRAKGLPAVMVIGCHKMPFRGHAWVEVDGQVVNDSPKVQTFYRVLERC